MTVAGGAGEWRRNGDKKRRALASDKPRAADDSKFQAHRSSSALHSTRARIRNVVRPLFIWARVGFARTSWEAWARRVLREKPAGQRKSGSPHQFASRLHSDAAYPAGAGTGFRASLEVRKSDGIRETKIIFLFKIK